MKYQYKARNIYSKQLGMDKHLKTVISMTFESRKEIVRKWYDWKSDINNNFKKIKRKMDIGCTRDKVVQMFPTP